MRKRLKIKARRESNSILGDFYRVKAWRGNTYLGERIYTGHTKRESLRLARDLIDSRGELFI